MARSTRKKVAKAATKPSAAKTRPRAKASAPAPRKSATTDKSSVPRLRAYLAVSLDGYIADPNGGVDWLNPYFTSEVDFPAFVRTIGATVMGRTTFDWSVSHGHGAGGFGRAVVLTHRPIANAPARLEGYAGDVRVLVERLRGELAGTGKDVWLMGGGKSIAAFHAQGLVDRWELAIIPTLLGEGIPLFPRHGRGMEGLRVVESRALRNGIVSMTYEPAARA